MPLLSVIIPTYNRPKMLANCLESLTKQSFKDFNITIVIDGGKDIIDYTQVISQFDLNIKTITLTENSGSVSIPRAIGIVNSDSKYIAPVDDDIYNYPNKFDVLLRSLESSTKKLAYGAMKVIDGPITYSFIPDWNPLICWGVDNSQIIYNRNVYKYIPVEFPRRACDWELAKLIYKRFPGFISVPKIVSSYTWHGGNRSLDETTKTKEIFPTNYKSYLDNKGYRINYD
jgi:glycosyltransferase involved in cell wall biosynthesis